MRKIEKRLLAYSASVIGAFIFFCLPFLVYTLAEGEALDASSRAFIEQNLKSHLTQMLSQEEVELAGIAVSCESGSRLLSGEALGRLEKFTFLEGESEVVITPFPSRFVQAQYIYLGNFSRINLPIHIRLSRQEGSWAFKGVEILSMGLC